MTIYITQGRYTREAIKGMIVKPEDRADAISRAMSKVGGRLIGYYVTFGEFDFLSICEAPDETHMMAALLAAAGGRRGHRHAHDGGADLDRSDRGLRRRGRRRTRFPLGRRSVRAVSKKPTKNVQGGFMNTSRRLLLAAA